MSVRMGKGPDGFTVDSTQFIPRPLSELFPFYADARNLERITPDFLQFRVMTEGSIELRPGALIDYQIRLHGIPIRWRTEITEWSPPYRFRDRQLKGPYRKWDHLHTFEDVDGGTNVIDHVDYLVPGGALVNRLFVAGDVEKIFAHRQEVLAEIFS